MRITDVRRLTGASVGLGFAALCVVQSASAQIVVDTPITTQVTDTVDGQTITVTPSGSITTTGGTEAVDSDNADVTITNNGSIATEGGAGISSEGNDAAITNNGDITAQDDVGIDSRGDDATITNNGSITTLGSDEDAIYVRGDDAIVINAGSITTLGPTASGIQGASVVTNTGSITVHGDRGRGISSGDIITNSGTIIMHGAGARAVRTSAHSATITNSGTIRTIGLATVGPGSISADGILSSGDNTTIANSGTIITEGNAAYAIRSTGTGSTITNSGSLSTQGPGSVAIGSTDANASITNSGSISTQSVDAHGISSSGTHASIANTGSISTLGEAFGILSNGTDASIINGGSIFTQGIGALGIYAAHQRATVTNNGSITMQGEDAIGISSSESNVTIINAGTITTPGQDALGIASLGIDATIFNSGRIDSSGVGIESQGDNVVITNSGRVVSASGQSIFFEDPATAFNLLPGSFLGGRVVMDGGVMPVNITTGPSHSTLTLFATAAGGLPTFTGGAPSFSGPVPGFYNAGTGHTATYDPTVLARMGGMTQDLAGGISGQIGGRFTPSAPSATRFANAFAAAADPASEEDAGAFGGFVSTYDPTTVSVHGAWVSGFGSFSSQDGNQAALDSDSWAAGLSVGYDQVINTSLTLGILAGFNTATLQADSRWVPGTVDHDARGGYAGIYGRYAPAAHGWYVDGALLAGFLAHENVRFVNDSMAVGGVSSARSDYDSWWIAPELGVGYTYDTAENWTLTPSAQVRLAVQSFDGYTETGSSAANATIGSWTSSSLQGRAQLAASYTGYAGVRITGRLGADARTDIGDDSVSTTLIGQTQAMPTFADDTLAGFVGLDGDYALTDTTSLNFSTEFSASSAGTSISAGLRIQMSF